jgi:RNA polymerase sigma-70 factor (ECF subfamily)
VRRDLVRHLPSLVAHARRLTRDRDQADDLVQAAVLRSLVFADSFAAGTNLKGWLHQVLESVFLSGCRRRGRERRALLGMESDPCAWFRRDALPAMNELSPPVASALERLPAGYRDVVRLVDVQELSYRDAATELSVPLGTVMSRLHRGRRLLAETLAGTAPNELDSAAPSAAAA